MLTSFFRKSTPLNFLIVVFLAFIFYVIYNFSGNSSKIDVAFILKELIIFVVFLFLLLFINFILIKDKSAGRHTYVIFLLTLFCIASPHILTDKAVILGGFVTVLGLRRTIALQTGKHITQKIFDSFFCFILASLFFPPAILFIIVSFFGLFYYGYENYKNWLTPIVAVLSVFILQTTISLATQDTFFYPVSHYSLQLINFNIYSQPQIFWPLSLILLFAFWAIFNIFSEGARLTQNELRAKHLLFIAFLSSIAILGFSCDTPNPLESALFFLILPTSLIGGRYFEIKKHKLLKEILLISLTIITISLGIYLNAI